VTVQLFCGGESGSTYTASHTDAYEWLITIESPFNCPTQRPLSCAYTFEDGSKFDFSGLTTETGTVVTGTQSDVYDISQDDTKHRTVADVRHDSIAAVYVI
jgi:hypothetical protein